MGRVVAIMSKECRHFYELHQQTAHQLIRQPDCSRTASQAHRGQGYSILNIGLWFSDSRLAVGFLLAFLIASAYLFSTRSADTSPTHSIVCVCIPLALSVISLFLILITFLRRPLSAAINDGKVHRAHHNGLFILSSSDTAAVADSIIRQRSAIPGGQQVCWAA